MKRVLFVLLLLWSSATVFAEEAKGKEANDRNPAVRKALKNTSACQMTMSSMVGAPGNQVEIKCSYTAYNCWVALVQVLICLDDLKKEVIQ